MCVVVVCTKELENLLAVYCVKNFLEHGICVQSLLRQQHSVHFSTNTAHLRLNKSRHVLGVFQVVVKQILSFNEDFGQFDRHSFSHKCTELK